MGIARRRTGMAIQWDEELELGEQDIDLQHREIFVYFDKLTEAIQRGDGKGVVIETLRYLDNYCSSHFKDEENLMESLNYPYIEEQQRQHRIFKANLNMLYDLLIKNVERQEISLKVDSMLIKYFITHIRNLDKALAKFIKQQV
jgi:hemerythrin-like metal-binding protein